MTEIGAPEGIGATVDPVSAGSGDIAGRSPWRLSMERLRSDRTAMISLGVIILIIVIALIAPVFAMITGHPVNEQYRSTGLTPDGLPVGPNGTFWFGTDDLGRDLLVRIAYGARISMLVSVVSTAITVALGTVIGLAAGYYGGFVDTILSRFTDLILSFPFLLFALALTAVLGPSIPLLIGIIALFGWSSVSRVVRAQTLSLRRREFVEASLSLGASDGRIMFLELLPNVLAPVIVYATLSFLGIGIQPPTPTWGGMLSESVSYYRVAWWFVMFPGLALLTTTLAFNLFGDSVRDAFDPKSRR
jgi:peptide/nickel transport system permease protein